MQVFLELEVNNFFCTGLDCESLDFSYQIVPIDIFQLQYSRANQWAWLSPNFIYKLLFTKTGAVQF
jgi:hypothetical protein